MSCTSSTPCTPCCRGTQHFHKSSEGSASWAEGLLLPSSFPWLLPGSAGFPHVHGSGLGDTGHPEPGAVA